MLMTHERGTKVVHVLGIPVALMGWIGPIQVGWIGPNQVGWIGPNQAASCIRGRIFWCL